MTPRRIRFLARSVHLLAAAALGLHVYGPLHMGEALRPALQFVLFPLVALTGIALWKQAQIRRLLSRSGRTNLAAGADITSR
jgi:hypothetical protein